MGNKSLVQIRSDLRLDLSDTGSKWSDAELDRSVERAVSDLSRFLPLERVFDKSFQFTITDEAYTSPVDTDPDRFVDNQTFNALVAGSTFTLAGTAIDFPRVVTLLVTDADDSITNWVIIVKGRDVNDNSLEETFFFQNGKSQTGIKEFKGSIMEVELDQVSGTLDAGDVLDIGTDAFTTCWVTLANKPIKYHSETHSTNLTINDDFFMDYANGRLQLTSAGGGTAATSYTISYLISQLHLDLSSLPDLIRVSSVIYPVGDVPQTAVPWDIWARVLIITGTGEHEEQALMGEDRQIAVYYDAEHEVPNIFGPGSYPSFLENTVLLAAGAYALFIHALKFEQQAVTDFASARTAIGNVSHTLVTTALAAANTAADNAETALVKVDTYLVSNSSEDSKFHLTKITTDLADLRTAIVAAQDAANAYLDSVKLDLDNATSARENYMGVNNNYVDGGTEPDVKAYLTTGDALINNITVGGENERTPELYALYARMASEGLVAPFERDRAFYGQNATNRVNAALAYAQEIAQRLSNLRSYIEQADGWGRIAAGFVNEATERNAAAQAFIQEAAGRISEINAYLAESDRDIALAVHNMSLSDRFSREAELRRDEAWTIWRDRKQYIGDFSGSSTRQPAMTSRTSY